MLKKQKKQRFFRCYRNRGSSDVKETEENRGSSDVKETEENRGSSDDKETEENRGSSDVKETETEVLQMLKKQRFFRC